MNTQIIISSLLGLFFVFFLLGMWGLVYKEIGHIYRLICIEFVILSFIYLFIFICFYYSFEALSQTFCLYVIGVAAAESVVGLTILLMYYRTFGEINEAN